MLVNITWIFHYVISGGFFMLFFNNQYSLCKQKRFFIYFTEQNPNICSIREPYQKQHESKKKIKSKEKGIWKMETT